MVFTVCGLQHHESTPRGTPRNFSRDKSGPRALNIDIYNGIARFPWDSTAFLLRHVCIVSVAFCSRRFIAVRIRDSRRTELREIKWHAPTVSDDTHGCRLSGHCDCSDRWLQIIRLISGWLYRTVAYSSVAQCILIQTVMKSLKWWCKQVDLSRTSCRPLSKCVIIVLMIPCMCLKFY